MDKLENSLIAAKLAELKASGKVTDITSEDDALGNWFGTFNRRRIIFASGFQLSVVWGHGAYADDDEEVEIAVFKPNDEWAHISDYDQVIGHVAPAYLVRVLDFLAGLNATSLITPETFPTEDEQE